MVGRAVAALQRRIQRQVSKPHGHRVGRSGARKQQRRKSAHARQANTPALPLPSLCWLFIASAESPPGDCRALEAPEARGGAGAAQMPTNPPPCLSNHRGIIGGAGAAFWRLAWIIFAPRQTCTNFRNSAEGREESDPAHIPIMLRVIWTGVRMSPQGKPHQPDTRKKGGCFSTLPPERGCPQPRSDRVAQASAGV